MTHTKEKEIKNGFCVLRITKSAIFCIQMPFSLSYSGNNTTFKIVYVYLPINYIINAKDHE